MNAIQIFRVALIVSYALYALLLSLSITYTSMTFTDLLPDVITIIAPIVGYRLVGLYQKHKKPKYYIYNGEARLTR